jgi:hypothetical protein
MEGIFVPISFFLTFFAVMYVYLTTRSRERLSLIEKGATANIFKMDPTESRLNLVKWGIFLIGLSAGVITGYALSEIINEVVAFFTTILLTGGIALIVAYVVTKKMDNSK